MKRFIWLFLSLVFVGILYIYIVPHSNIVVIGKSPLSIFYIHLTNFGVSILFFFLNAFIIKKNLNNVYSIHLYLILVLTFFFFFLLNLKASSELSTSEYSSTILALFVVASIFFYLTYSIARAVKHKIQINKFILLLPIVFINVNLISTYWIFFLSLYLYVLSSTIKTSHNYK